MKALPAAIALVAMAGCGLYGGGGSGTKVEVNGTIADVVPDPTGRDIVVFVYRVQDAPADCTTAVLPDSNTEYENVDLQDGQLTFEVKKVKTGRLVIAFLLDNPGKDADGRIDDGDPVAVLNDPDCLLDDVPDRYVIEANAVLANFSGGNVLGFPSAGRAEAGDLREFPAP